MDDMITRRRFVGLSVATGATILAGGKILGSTVAGPTSIAPGTAANPTFKIGGDLEVNRLGFGAMRLTGEGVWGWPQDRANPPSALLDRRDVIDTNRSVPAAAVSNSCPRIP